MGPRRKELVLGAFAACDRDGDGLLCAGEMERFARLTGFSGSESEWAHEFSLLCRDVGASASEGLTAAHFGSLVSDPSDGGCYCSDEELERFAAELRAAFTRLVDDNSVLGCFCGPAVADAPVATAATANSSPPAVGAGAAPAGRPGPAPAAALSPAPPAQPPAAAAPSNTAPAAALTMTVAPEAARPRRAELAAALFRACDADGNGRLVEAEMWEFAQLSGFEGSREEWGKEFALLCGDHDMDPRTGVDEPVFRCLLDDDSQEGCYCSDAELETILATLQPKPKPVLEPRNAGFLLARCTPERESLIRAVFGACDVDGDRFLSLNEMRRFANHVGFDDTDEVWAGEYTSLCVDNSADPALGIDVDLFAKIVCDLSDKGLYCKDTELEAMLPLLAAEAVAERVADFRAGLAGGVPLLSGKLGSLKRDELVAAVFRACDQDGDGMLSATELGRFAVRTGFAGTDVEWRQEFQALCAEQGGDPALGFDSDMFAALVSDQSGNGCYCNDKELSDMLAAFGREDGGLF